MIIFIYKPKHLSIMTATYYRIYDAINPLITLDEGIIRNSEDTIYPGQNNSDEDYKLPFECEADHFYQPNSAIRKAEIELINFSVSEEYIRSNKI